MSTLEVLLRLVLVFAIFRVLGYPLARLMFPGATASAYAFATAAAMLVAGHITWLLAHLGLTIGAGSMAIGLAVVAVASTAALLELRGAGAEFWPSPANVVSHHLALVLAFALALLITARNPSVDPDSERPMDLAMVNAVVASRSLPLEDPWLAGERVSYYDYGYYTTAYLAILSGIDTARLFPVAVSLVFATLLAGALAVGRDLAGWTGGVAAAWLVAVAGNLDAVWQTLAGAPAFDWFQSARSIHGGVITEFPFFTLLWGDLHPYALALPYWPLMLAIAVVVSRSSASRWTIALGAVGYAALLATHSWDAVPVAAVMTLAGLLGARRYGLAALRGPALVVLLGGLLAAPYLLAFPTGARGLRFVSSPSTVVELFTMWGVPCLLLGVAVWRPLVVKARAEWVAPALALLSLAIAWLPQPGAGIALVATLTALVLAANDDAKESFAWVLVAVGSGLVFGVEVLYVDDVYSGDLERMNTVFKAYIQAWVLLGISAAALAAGVARRWFHAGRWGRGVALASGLVFLVATIVYPLRATSSRSGDLLRPFALDARVAFTALYPDDAAAVELLRQAPRGVVLEASGGPYSWDGRFATFTGYPTVLGWAHHEAGWRNSWELLTPRVNDIVTAYETLDLDLLQTILRRYHVRYVVVGELERDRFGGPGLAKFEHLEVAARAGDSVVYRVGAM